MKATILLSIALPIYAFTSTADDSRYVTVTAPAHSTQVGVIQVQQGETAEIVTCQYAGGGAIYSCNVLKDGFVFLGYPPGAGTAANTAMPHGTIVSGPATITTLTNNSDPMLITAKITPQAYDVTKTLIIAPGTNQFYVTLESSTNLVLWADATNAVYGSPDAARFFRIRMTPLSSP